YRAGCTAAKITLPKLTISVAKVNSTEIIANATSIAAAESRSQAVAAATSSTVATITGTVVSSMTASHPPTATATTLKSGGASRIRFIGAVTATGFIGIASVVALVFVTLL
ncbi:hypothetical protein FRB98_003902, partial [Tulasnella sp. 332]